jgi:4-amino-4-deoxy-L-arabinose transferase-like glycosyltransferase
MTAPASQSTFASVRRYWTLFFALLAFNVLLRIVYARFEFLLNPDELLWAVAAREFLAGKTLYREVWLDKPPGATLIYAAIFAFTGVKMLAIRIFAPVYVFLTALVVRAITKKLFDDRIAWMAAFLFSYLSVNYFPEDMILLNTELLMLLPLSGATWCFLRGLIHDDQRVAYFIAAGILTAVATLIKPVALLNLLFFAVAPFFPKSRRDARTILTAAFNTFAGMALVFGAFYLILDVTDAREAFLRDALLTGAHYVADQTWAETLRRSTGLLSYVGYNAAFVALAAYALRKRDNGHTWMWLWLVASLLGAVAGRRFYGHYFIQLMPPLAILAAVGLRGLEKRLRSAPTIQVRAFAAALLVVTAFSFYRFQERTIVFAFDTVIRRPIADRWLLVRFNRDIHNIAAYVDSNTAPHDAIFVWGFKPEIYYASKRPLASRYLSFVPLTGWTHGMPATLDFSEQSQWVLGRKLLLADLESSKPLYIIDMASVHDFGMNHAMENYPDLREYLHQHYRRDSTYSAGDNTAIYYRRVN